MLQTRETPLLFTENSIHNKDLRLKLTEFLFEKYKVPALFLCKDAVLSAFACGRSSAIVLDTGCTKTYAVPVHDGYALQKSILRCAIGGETITDRFEQWLRTTYKDVEIKPRFLFKRKFKQVDGQPHFDVTPVDEPNVDPSYLVWSQKQILRELKRDLFYVAEEPLTGIGAHQTVRSQTFELPDGT